MRSEAASVAPPRSDGEDFLLLLLRELVDLGDEPVGGLLDLIEGAPLFVLRYLLALGKRLETVVGVPTDIADGHTRVLGEFAHRLGELLAPFLRQGRHDEADELAVIARREAEVGLLDRLLDGGDLRGVPRL